MILKSNKCAKPFIIVVTFSIFLTVVYVKVVKNSIINSIDYYERVRNYNSKPFNKGPKTILLWNSFFTRADWYLPAETVNETYFDNEKCPERNCFVTANRTLLKNISQFDAILFHMPQILKPTEYPTERSTHQLYIFVNYESPPHTKNNLPSNIEIFNLTLTYRLDSDIVRPYGYVVDKETKQIVAPNYRPAWREPDDDFQLDKRMEGVIRNKTKMVAWFVSHCNTISNREGLVRALKNYVHVDIVGDCGNLECSKTEDCDSKLDSLYKFYLSFENSLCADYVTEKLFNALNRTIIPIVYGGADYNRFAPPHSYINVEDFASVEELGNFLKFLDSNPKEYQKYFWWKRYYTIDKVFPFCDICRVVNNPSQREKVQYYKNIEEWWIGHQCRFEPKIKY